jgi:hypothetical protein
MTRVAFVVVAVVAVLGGWMLARPVQAEAAQNVLTGKPRIGTVRAMVPQRGRDAGRLVVWVRVGHAPGTLRGVLRERPETVHTGRVVARVGGASRVATQQIELDRHRVAGGYFLRFPKATGRAVSAGVARRVPVSLRAAQTVDLDSDGHNEQRTRAAATRTVTLATPTTTIEPKDGQYQNTANDSIDVSGGYVTSFGFLSATDGPCGVGPGDEVYAPIDPQTGLFGFTSRLEGYGPTTLTNVNGEFTGDQKATVFATISVDNTNCSYNITNHDFTLFKWPPAPESGG